MISFFPFPFSPFPPPPFPYGSTRKFVKKNFFLTQAVRISSGGLRVERGGSGAKAPPLAARPREGVLLGQQQRPRLFVCLFVKIKPEKLYSASCWASCWEGSKPPGNGQTRAEAQTATCIPKTEARQALCLETVCLFVCLFVCWNKTLN